MIITRPKAQQVQATAICSSSDSVGDLVYVSAGVLDNAFQVSRADVTQGAKMPVVGVIVAKLGPTRAVVQYSGEVYGQYTGLQPGRVYFVGTDARPSLTPPGPGSLGTRAYVQPIGVAMDYAILKLIPNIDVKVRVG